MCTDISSQGLIWTNPVRISTSELRSSHLADPLPPVKYVCIRIIVVLHFLIRFVYFLYCFQFSKSVAQGTALTIREGKISACTQCKCKLWVAATVLWSGLHKNYPNIKKKITVIFRVYVHTIKWTGASWWSLKCVNRVIARMIVTSPSSDANPSPRFNTQFKHCIW